MSIEERRSLFLRLDQMIRMKVPGRAKELAYQLDISRSTFFRVLDEMRMMGAPIEYDESCGRYRYAKKGRFRFGFLPANQLSEIEGGRLVKGFLSFLKI